jgi:hypothetical protein
MISISYGMSFDFGIAGYTFALTGSSIYGILYGSRGIHPMRKIETQMNQAIQSEIDWKKDNTQVISIEGVSLVYLYNNLIAMVGDTWLELFDAGHQTKTTKSRLNAILFAHGNGERIYQKDYQWFLSTTDGDVEFNGTARLD